MTSFDSSTPCTVSELVAPKIESNSNVLQGPVAVCIDSDVQAFAKLEGEDFFYYVRKLQVSLGRRVSVPENVDVPLGNTKSVSRQHASLFYNFSLQRFELTIFGKNGAFVNEQFIERGVTVPLENKTKVQIGEIAFVFLLPRFDQPKRSHVNTNNNQNDISAHGIEDLGYISTPHQLEKVARATSSSLQGPVSSEFMDMRNEGSIKDENVNYHTSKDIKPPYSYASLIVQAISSSREKRMTLNGIYKHITTNYPYYQMAQNGWQNSIRHNLSLNKAFIKVARSNSEPGKGAFWMIDSNTEPQLAKGLHKRQKRPTQQDDSRKICTSNDGEADNAKKRLKKEHVIQRENSDSEEELASLNNIPKQDHTSNANDQHVNSSTDRSINLQETTELLAVGEKDISAILTQETAPDAILSPTNNKKKRKKAKFQQHNTDAQAQLQEQLQNTIRQHLLDPVLYPLPPSIAQLLPEAIAQLPPQLATQLSSSVQKLLIKPNPNDTGISSTETLLPPESSTTTISTNFQTNPTINDHTDPDNLTDANKAKVELKKEL